MDAYTLKARIFPAFLLFLPLAFAVAAWTPEAKLPVITLFGLSGNIAMSFFVAERVRDCGKNKEHALWAAWGGPPTTQLLRHRNSDIAAAMRNGWRRALETLVGAPMPSAASEAKSPKKADDAYEAAIARLRELTREVEKYPLVFKENVSYGFRRNLWALKPTGIFLSIGSSLACTAKIVYSSLREWDFESHSVISLMLSVVFLVCWLVVIRRSWVRLPAFEYAKRLLGASFLLVDSKAQKSTGS